MVDKDKTTVRSWELDRIKFFVLFVFAVAVTRTCSISITISVRNVDHLLYGVVVVIFDRLEQLGSCRFHIRMCILSHSYGIDLRLYILVVQRSEKGFVVAPVVSLVGNKKRNTRICIILCIRARRSFLPLFVFAFERTLDIQEKKTAHPRWSLWHPAVTASWR